MKKQTITIENESGTISTIQPTDFEDRIYELLGILEQISRKRKDYKKLRSDLVIVYSTYCFFVKYYNWEKDDYIEQNKNEIILHMLEESNDSLRELSKSC